MGIDAITIDSANRVGIGTTAPSRKLHVSSGADNALFESGTVSNQIITVRSGSQTGTGAIAAIEFQNGSSGKIGQWIGTEQNSGALQLYSNSVERIRVDSLGNVGIGTTTPGGQFELSLDQGRKPSTSTWTIVSDERLKIIKGTYSKGLKEVIQLNPILYRYKNTAQRRFDEQVLQKTNVGFSAQDVQKIFPECVETDKDGILNFNFHAILVAYANAFKEQQKMIEKQKQEIEKLKIRLQKIEASIGIQAEK